MSSESDRVQTYIDEKCTLFDKKLTACEKVHKEILMYSTKAYFMSEI
jgi:hypothetical protein